MKPKRVLYGLFIIMLISFVLLMLYIKQEENKEEIRIDYNFYQETNYSNLEIKNIQKNELENNLELAGDWLLRMQKPNGDMEYEYFPLKDEYSKDKGIVRHMGSLWGFGLLYQYTKDEKYLKALEKGIKFVLENDYIDKEEFSYIKYNNSVNIGSAGLFMLAMLNSDNPKKYDKELKRLKNFIINQQREDGSFKTEYLKDEIDSEYYPGEALLALINLYEYDNDEEYLEVLKKAFPYYKNYFMENPNVAMITWHSQAYSKAFFITKNKDYANYVFMLNDWNLLKQNFEGNESILGGYGNIPGISTAVYNEGMNDAFLVAISLNDSRLEKYKASVKLATQFILQLQSKNYNNIKALGGFGFTLTNPNQRIDNTQHAINSIIKTLRNYKLLY